MKISRGFCVALAVAIAIVIGRQFPDELTAIGAMLGYGFRVGMAIIGAAAGLIGVGVHDVLRRVGLAA